MARTKKLVSCVLVYRPYCSECASKQADRHLITRFIPMYVFLLPGNLCADTLLKNESEFAPFCEYDDDKIPDFTHYVDRVRSSSDWGGHLELRVLSVALQKHILVYSAQTKEPLHIKPEQCENDDDPIRLSYHLHYYALGEHYNRVVKAAS